MVFKNACAFSKLSYYIHNFVEMNEVDCVFCRIIKGELPSKKVYEDDEIIAFHDINPVAPVHILVLPKRHIIGLSEIGDNDTGLIGRIFVVMSKLARQLNVSPGTEMSGGYRVVNNCGRGAGQSVFHIHFHLIGGRKFSWPPG